MYDEKAGTYTLKAKQMTPPTVGQEKKVPVLIPIAIGLLGSDGKDMLIKLQVGCLLDNSLVKGFRQCLLSHAYFVPYTAILLEADEVNAQFPFSRHAKGYLGAADQRIANV